MQLSSGQEATEDENRDDCNVPLPLLALLRCCPRRAHEDSRGRRQAGYEGWQASRYAGKGFVSHMPGLKRHGKPVVCNSYACSPIGERSDEHYSANGDCTR